MDRLDIKRKCQLNIDSIKKEPMAEEVVKSQEVLQNVSQESSLPVINQIKTEMIESNDSEVNELNIRVKGVDDPDSYPTSSAVSDFIVSDVSENESLAKGIESYLLFENCIKFNLNFSNLWQKEIFKKTIDYWLLL